MENSDSSNIGFIVMPNQAMSWQGIVRWYIVICVVTLAIGVAFYMRGLTLILPFSGLEIVALGLALYVTAWRSGEKEVIIITADLIAVEKGYNKPEKKERFQRPWSRIVLERPRYRWHPSRLLIRSRGLQLEIGSFLNEEERQGLAEELQRAMNRVTHQ